MTDCFLGLRISSEWHWTLDLSVTHFPPSSWPLQKCHLKLSKLYHSFLVARIASHCLKVLGCWAEGNSRGFTARWGCPCWSWKRLTVCREQVFSEPCCCHPLLAYLWHPFTQAGLCPTPGQNRKFSLCVRWLFGERLNNFFLIKVQKVRFFFLFKLDFSISSKVQMVAGRAIRVNLGRAKKSMSFAVSVYNRVPLMITSEISWSVNEVFSTILLGSAPV